MHLFMLTRGAPEYTKRFITELQRKYYKMFNKDTKKATGAIQLMPREVKTWEVIFPETEKKNIKKFIKAQANKLDGGSGYVAVHFGPFKKDKYKDGNEML